MRKKFLYIIPILLLLFGFSGGGGADPIINGAEPVPSATLVGYWSFDEGSGDIAYDNSGNGNDGTLVNMEAGDWVNGIAGKCLSFDRGNDYLDLTGLTDAGTTHSFSCWAYSRNSVAVDMFVLDSQTGRIILGWGTGTAGKIGIYDGVWKVFGDSPSADTWHHIVFLLDGAISKMKMYLNGVQYGSELDYTPHAIGDSVTIGARHCGTTSYFNGIIDEFRVYNTILTEDEIKTLYLYHTSKMNPILNPILAPIIRVIIK